jgi:hypothetical protein
MDTETSTFVRSASAEDNPAAVICIFIPNRVDGYGVRVRQRTAAPTCWFVDDAESFVEFAVMTSAARALRAPVRCRCSTM